jgi:hypothetical protein
MMGSFFLLDKRKTWMSLQKAKLSLTLSMDLSI